MGKSIFTGNTFKGTVPVYFWANDTGINEFQRIFAAAMLRNRLKNAKTLLFEGIVFGGFAVLMLFGLGILVILEGSTMMHMGGAIALLILAVIVAIINYAEIRDPLNLIRNRKKYEDILKEFDYD